MKMVACVYILLKLKQNITYCRGNCKERCGSESNEKRKNTKNT